MFKHILHSLKNAKLIKRVIISCASFTAAYLILYQNNSIIEKNWNSIKKKLYSIKNNYLLNKSKLYCLSESSENKINEEKEQQELTINDNINDANLFNNWILYIIHNESNKNQDYVISKFLDSLYSIGMQEKFQIKIISNSTNHSQDSSTSSKDGDSINSNISKFNQLLISTSLEKCKKANDPVILVSNNNSFANRVNPYEIINSPNKGKEMLVNLTTLHQVTDYISLRDHFGFLSTNPENSIYLINSESIKDNEKENLKNLSLFCSSKSKLIILDNKALCESLELKPGVIYEYKTPKIPNKLKTTAMEKFFENQALKKSLQNQEQNNDNKSNNNSQKEEQEEEKEEEEEVNDEYLAKYMNNNPVSFLLRFNLFRNEYLRIEDEHLPVLFGSDATNNNNKNSKTNKNILYHLPINKNFKEKVKDNQDKNSNSNISKSKSVNQEQEEVKITDSSYHEIWKKQLIHYFYYKKQNIMELAETDLNSINKLLKEKDNHILYIYVPNYSFLKEKVLEFILFGKLTRLLKKLLL